MHNPYDQTLALLHECYGLATAQVVENFLNSRHLCAIARSADPVLADLMYTAHVQMFLNTLEALALPDRGAVTRLVASAVAESNAEPLPLRVSPYRPVPTAEPPIDPATLALLHTLK